MTIRLDGQTAIVTGGAQGLGRAYALALARAGAAVVVNDLAASEQSDALIAEIEATGGQARFFAGDVTDPATVESMVEAAINAFGHIDILVNNAGILRDKSFAKLPLEDFQRVIDVHLTGSAIVTQAVWGVMRAAGYGRIVMATSSSGLYGNFGQANYAAAKMGLIGLMNTLNLEGAKHGIAVNAVAPVAHTRMTADLFPVGADTAMAADLVAPAVVFLASRAAPAGAIVSAGGGAFAFARLVETEAVSFGPLATADDVAGAWARTGDRPDPHTPASGSAHSQKFFAAAGLAEPA